MLGIIPDATRRKSDNVRDRKATWYFRFSYDIIPERFRLSLVVLTTAKMQSQLPNRVICRVPTMVNLEWLAHLHHGIMEELGIS